MIIFRATYAYAFQDHHPIILRKVPGLRYGFPSRENTPKPCSQLCQTAAGAALQKKRVARLLDRATTEARQ